MDGNGVPTANAHKKAHTKHSKKQKRVKRGHGGGDTGVAAAAGGSGGDEAGAGRPGRVAVQGAAGSSAAAKSRKRRRVGEAGGSGNGAATTAAGPGTSSTGASVGAAAGAGTGAGAGAGAGAFGGARASGRKYTVSIALPGSIVDNAQSPELQAYLTSQLARAAAIFNIDEVVVFNESSKSHGAGTAESAKAMARGWDPNHYLARLLQYQETPQYLRRILIPRHRDLRFAGLLNPLDTPHHMRADEVAKYREGVVVKRPCPNGSLVNVGIYKDVRIDQKVPAGVRVTVRMPEKQATTPDGKLKRDGKTMRGTAVAPSTPREEDGLYWGYNVRLADSISAVFTESPYPGGYDVTMGTSERGNVSVDDREFTIPRFKHLLVVFGGVAGLEASVDADEHLTISGEDASCLFDMWVNTCPAQGSRTIRTEEAILISMAALRSHITSNEVPEVATASN